MTGSLWLVGVVGGCLSGTPSYDPIDIALADVRATPFFGNGVHRVIHLPENAKDSEIIAAAYPTWNFPGKQPTYLILEERNVKLPESARAVSLRTGDMKIVCFLEYAQGGWTIDMVFE